ncbi:MAG TPA: LacI family DNA-binding transcriptional regulator [Anaerolineae bacterium]|nr:LacI family DNA-binding transcriptional regulator [Anaerolineae bacterium]
MSNIRDVAKLAGVAPITVSRVVNGADNVADDTRQRVQQAIDHLHYVPNTLARSLRSHQSHTIALIVSDITNPFWTTVARGVEDTAAENDYRTILCNTDENPAKETNYLNLLVERRVDGVIIAPTTRDKRQLAMLKQLQVPCVLIDRRVDGFRADRVYGDSRTGARLLIDHLVDLGHQRIALINGPSTISTAQDRADGYRESLLAHSIVVEEDLILQGDFKQESGHRLTQQALACNPRPTAIFAANNFIALGVLQALQEAGLRVPEDMALVCIDDVPYSSAIDPFLTVAAQPAYEMGASAARLLVERLTTYRSGKVREVVLPPQLIIRRSCGQGLPINQP